MSVKILPQISNFDLKCLLRGVLQSFPELQGWIFWIAFANIETYGLMNAKFLCFGHSTVKFGAIRIAHRLRGYARSGVESIIAHELAHAVFIDQGSKHTEADVAKEVISRGFHDGIRDLFFSDCPGFCNGKYKKTIGGVYCRQFCPWITSGGSA